MRILVLALARVLGATGQACVTYVGNRGPGTTEVYGRTDSSICWPFTAGSSGIVTVLGVDIDSVVVPGNMRLALYSDKAGKPHLQITATVQFPASPGITEVPGAAGLPLVSAGNVYHLCSDLEPGTSILNKATCPSPCATASVSVNGLEFTTPYTFANSLPSHLPNIWACVGAAAPGATARVHGDPHFTSFSGGTYEVRGDPGHVYNVVSGTGLLFNALFIPGSGVSTWIGAVGVRAGNCSLQWDASNETILLWWAADFIETGAGPQVKVDHVLALYGLQLMYWPAEHTGGFQAASHCRYQHFFYMQSHNLDSGGNFHASRRPFHFDFSVTMVDRAALTGTGGRMHGLLGQTASFTEPTPQWSKKEAPQHINGQGVIEGSYEDYEVTSLLSGDFKFSTYIPHDDGL
eukprot:gene2139-3069_t